MKKKKHFSQKCCILDFRLNGLNLSETQGQLFDCWRQLCTIDNVLYETFIYGWETRIKNQKERPVKGCFFIKTVSIVTNHISVQQTCTNQLPLRHVKLMKIKQMREWNLNFHFFERTFFWIEAVKNSLTMQQSPVLSQYFFQKVVVMFIARPYP